MKKQLITFSLLLACYVSFGQNWVPVGVGVSNYVNAMDSANSLLYIGGRFDTAGGMVVNHITAWNGSTYSALGSGITGGTNPIVNAITEYNGKIIVAGRFTSAGGVPVNNIAMWNGISWSTLGIGVTGSYTSVSSLAVFNDNLYAAGSFDSAGGAPALHIAQWNGSSWSAVGAGISYVINTMAVYNNNLYIGGWGAGDSNKYYAALSKWNGAVWDSIKGLYAAYQSACQSNGINVLSTGNGQLYITGLFTDSAKQQGSFASWNGTSLNWNTGNGGFPSSSYYGTDFNSLCVYRDEIIGGSTDIIYYNDTAWKSVGNGIGYCYNASCNICGGLEPVPVVYTIAGYNGKLYAGGAFQTVYGNQASYLEMFSGIVGISEVKETNTITVYPNPSNGLFQLKIKNYELGMNKGVEVYNMLGEKIFSQYSLVTSQYSIDLSGQPSGVYLYRITNTDGSVISTGKLIKE